ncbi:phosphohexomutase domain-containing protein [Psittacicella hinzii]|uniref:phosphomannomutase n=1 Tax=Psittacicella hinzii TaxID=2028575 RepID=A0A3A1YNI4_9GAMM|nr:phosphomannomutase CpsG [Psittacicella hinzii]RIY39036.1 phosphomannomutase CpsG [Psittacicella hinzii]
MTEFNFSCFKAYDIRGKIGDELSFELAYNIGKAVAVYLNAKKVVVGSDIRLTSPEFKAQITKGLVEMGCDVVDIGQTGTEEVYFATSFLEADGGIQVTASHNPKDYNGLKIVGKNSVPLSIDTGLTQIKELIIANDFKPAEQAGKVEQVDLRANYVSKLLSFVDVDGFKRPRKLKLLFNVGNGAAGATVQYIAGLLRQHQANLDFEFLFAEPDGNFPNGIPNPLLVENREVTAQKVREVGADIGIAFDGDFDRCFFFDEKGEFIEGYYICGLLAQAFLAKNPGETIVYEPRLLWNSVDIIESNGGKGVLSKSGHSFIKRKLREYNAVYGGELSAHHYFRDYYFCDSGMIPWLLIVELVQKSQKNLSEFVADMRKKYPCSDEINFKVADSQKAIERVKALFAEQEKEESTVDGISYAFKDWRFNIRTSNTEPLLRLNVEAKENPQLVKQMVDLISKAITAE